MLYLIAVLNLIVAFVNRRKKLVTYFLLSMIFLLAAFSYGFADYDIYYGRFMYYDSDFLKDQTEPLYTFIIHIARNINMPYNIFLALEYFLIFGCFYFFVRKYTDNVNFVLLLYIIWPFCRDVSVIRTSIGSAFVYIGLTYFLRDEKKYLIQYVFFVMVGAMFHYGMLFFLIMIIIPLLPSKEDIVENRLLRLFFVIFVIEIFAFEAFPRLPFTGTIMTKINFVLQRSTDSNSIITAPGTLRTLLMFFVYLFLHKKVIGKLRRKKEDGRIKIATKIYYINLYVLLVIPFYRYMPDLCRLQQAIALLSYVEFSYYFSKYKSERYLSKDELVFWGECAFYAVLYLFIIVLHTDQFDTIFRALFEKNYLNVFR